MDVTKLRSDLIQGDRRSLAKAMTLVESSRKDMREAANELLAAVMPLTGRSLRIGITGIPGVGKSTFVEALGKSLVAGQHRLAVLAIDPSSPLSGGSIMGDRTRMEELSAHPDVFIRPSPSGGALGGVARRTVEVMVLAEAAGYDIVIIETIGVGQTEIAVASMVDVFLFLQMPGTGDELQGIKKGVLELADIIAVTKADGDLLKAAKRTKHDLEQALGLVRGSESWQPPVLLCSGLKETGITEVWDAVIAFAAHQQKTHAFDTRRIDQRRQWFEAELDETLRAAIKHDKTLAALLRKAERQVAEGRIPASVAAESVVKEIFGRV